MKTSLALAAILAIVPQLTLAKSAPLFAAECAGGVNRGGYNIDTDDRGHLWVNGHRVTLSALSAGAWEGGYHGVIFSITKDAGGLLVSWTGHGGDNGMCMVVSQ